jgi:hypothetical protein
MNITEVKKTPVLNQLLHNSEKNAGVFIFASAFFYSTLGMSTENITRRQQIILWLKRIGIVGFCFFLLKGIVWLVLGYYVLK